MSLKEPIQCATTSRASSQNPYSKVTGRLIQDLSTIMGDVCSVVKSWTVSLPACSTDCRSEYATCMTMFDCARIPSS